MQTSLQLQEIININLGRNVKQIDQILQTDNLQGQFLLKSRAVAIECDYYCKLYSLPGNINLQTRRSLSARKSVSSRDDNSEGELLAQQSQTRRSLSARKSVSSRDDNSEGELLAQQSQTGRSLSARKSVSSRYGNSEGELLAQQSQTRRSLSARKSISTYKTLVLTYTVLKGLAPNYLQELLKLRCPGRTLRSSSLSILDKPLSQRVTYGDRRFAVAAANCWNPLPNEVKNAESLASFRRQLKTHLFKQAFLI